MSFLYTWYILSICVAFLVWVCLLLTMMQSCHVRIPVHSLHCAMCWDLIFLPVDYWLINQTACLVTSFFFQLGYYLFMLWEWVCIYVYRYFTLHRHLIRGFYPTLVWSQSHSVYDQIHGLFVMCFNILICKQCIAD